jgi:hypothetical protein
LDVCHVILIHFDCDSLHLLLDQSVHLGNINIKSSKEW